MKKDILKDYKKLENQLFVSLKNGKSSFFFCKEINIETNGHPGYPYTITWYNFEDNLTTMLQYDTEIIKSLLLYGKVHDATIVGWNENE